MTMSGRSAKAVPGICYDCERGKTLPKMARRLECPPLLPRKPEIPSFAFGPQRYTLKLQPRTTEGLTILPDSRGLRALFCVCVVGPKLFGVFAGVIFVK